MGLGIGRLLGETFTREAGPIAAPFARDERWSLGDRTDVVRKQGSGMSGEEEGAHDVVSWRKRIQPNDRDCNKNFQSLPIFFLRGQGEGLPGERHSVEVDSLTGVCASYP